MSTTGTGGAVLPGGTRIYPTASLEPALSPRVPWSKNQAKRALGAVKVLLKAKPDVFDRATKPNGAHFYTFPVPADGTWPAAQGPVLSPGAVRQARDAIARLRDQGLDWRTVRALSDSALSADYVLLVVRAGISAAEVAQHQAGGTLPEREALAALAAMRR